MDSQADIDATLEAELEEWLNKTAEAMGLSREDLAQQELEVWRRWKQTQDPNDFKILYELHQAPMNSAAAKYLATAQLPKAAVRSDMLKGYITALNTYKPDLGVKMSSWIQTNMGHTGRYTQKYGSVVKMPPERANLAGLYLQRERHLSETLGRPPTINELADDMLLASSDIATLRAERITPKVVATMRKEIRSARLEEDNGAQAYSQDSRLRDRAVFLHGSLNPEQQVVLEHMYPVFGHQPTDDAGELAKRTGFSEQKVRAVKKQIGERLRTYT